MACARAGDQYKYVLANQSQNSTIQGDNNTSTQSQSSGQSATGGSTSEKKY